jgi:hypothetical protein
MIPRYGRYVLHLRVAARPLDQYQSHMAMRGAREHSDRATRSERAGEAASESACRGVRGAKPLGKEMEAQGAGSRCLPGDTAPEPRITWISERFGAGSVIPGSAECRHYRNVIAATPSYRDISLSITLSPGCRPLLISIRFTEAAPNCTGTFFAVWPSGSSLKSMSRLFD